MNELHQFNNPILKFGNQSLKLAKWLATYRAPLSLVLNFGIMLALLALPALGQSQPDPFGGSGTSKLSNAGSNVLVLATWAAFFVGLFAFVSIPVFIMFGWDYKKNILVGVTGLGGFAIIGSIAYDIVNLSSMQMDDVSLGN